MRLRLPWSRQPRGRHAAGRGPARTLPVPPSTSAPLEAVPFFAAPPAPASALAQPAPVATPAAAQPSGAPAPPTPPSPVSHPVVELGFADGFVGVPGAEHVQEMLAVTSTLLRRTTGE